MPKKSHRIAAKQAELGQRKRRAPKTASRVVVGSPAEHGSDDNSIEMESEPLTPTIYSHEIANPSAPTRISQRRPPQTTNIQTYNPYIWTEVQRIGIITVLVFIILAVLTITLG